MHTQREEVKHHFEDWCTKNQCIFIEVEANQTISRPIWRQMGDDGLLGCMISEEYGGAGLGLEAFVDLIKLLALSSPSMALSVLAHSLLCANTIEQFGSKEQKSKYLPLLASGQLVGCLGISEDEAGSDALAMRTSLKKDNNTSSHILNGHKMWITNGPIADIAVVYAKNEDKINACIVELTTTNKSKAMDKFGMKASPTGRLTFDSLKINNTQILPEQGYKILKKSLDIERIALSAIPIGIMNKAIAEIIPYVTTRQQFGSVLAAKQLIQNDIAEIYVKIQTTEALLEKALDKNIDKKELKMIASSLFLHSSQAATDVASKTMDIFGAMGYMQDSRIPKLLEDAKLFQTGGGSENIRKLIIGHILTGFKAY